MKHLWPWGLFLFCSLQIQAINFGDKLLSHKDPAYKKAQQVFNTIKKAIGDQSKPLPRLEIFQRTENIAAYRRKDNILIIEKKAYDVCHSFCEEYGDAALAFLIAHELSHFYQTHYWEGCAGTHFLPSSSTFEEHAQNEHEADIYGAFVVQLAGYSTQEVIPLFLEAIYAAYGSEAEVRGYPSLSRRKQVAFEALTKADELSKVYENGIYYMAIGQYLEAKNCFEYTLKYIRFKEAHNNLGATFLGLALQKIKTLFIYPIELDSHHPLRNINRITWDKKMLLSKAIEQFGKALEQDHKYISASINLACALNMLGNRGAANGTIKNLENHKSNLSAIQKGRIALVRGILFAEEGYASKAIKQFELAKAYTNRESIQYLAECNLKALATGSCSAPKIAIGRDLKDQIEGIYLALFEGPNKGYEHKVEFGLNQTLSFAQFKKSHFAFFLHLLIIL